MAGGSVGVRYIESGGKRTDDNETVTAGGDGLRR